MTTRNVKSFNANQLGIWGDDDEVLEAGSLTWSVNKPTALSIHDGVTSGGTPMPAFGVDGILTIPNTIKSQANQYLYLGSDTSVELSTSWPTHDNTGDPIYSGFYTNTNGSAAIEIDLQDSESKSWKFNSDGTTGFPGTQIAAPVGESITLHSTNYSQIMWENEDQTTGTNKAIVTDFYVEPNAAELDIGYCDGEGNRQSRTWFWSSDSSFSLPTGGSSIIFGDSSVQTTAYLGTGNIGFADNAMFNLGGVIVENADLSHGATSSLLLPPNGESNYPAQLNNTYGNVAIGAGTNGALSSQFTFGNDGGLTFPMGGGTIYGNWVPNLGSPHFQHLSIDTDFSLILPESSSTYAILKTGGFPIRLQAGSSTWDFSASGGTMTFPDGSQQTTAYSPQAVPSSHEGKSGDKYGMTASDPTYFYYCCADYTGNGAAIWRRIASDTNWNW